MTDFSIIPNQMRDMYGAMTDGSTMLLPNSKNCVVTENWHLIIFKTIS